MSFSVISAECCQEWRDLIFFFSSLKFCFFLF